MSTVRLLRAGFALVLVLGLFLPSPGPRAQGPDVEDLKRGLVATFQDDGRSIARVEPTVALALKAGEAPHPRLGGDAGKYQWTGHLNLLRAGKYRFSAHLRGRVAVQVGGKTVFEGEATEADAVLKEGAEVELEAGVVPLRVEYVRPAGVARLELLWQGPGFRREPLPPDFVGHVPAKGASPEAAQAVEDRGRYLFEEHSCVKCHTAPEHKIASGLASRPGPDLSKLGGRVHPGWVEKWLESPQALQPAAVMPAMFGPADDPAGKAERHAVARYLTSLGGKVPASANVPPKEAANRRNKGEKLYHSVGCVVCHGDYPSREAGKVEAGAFYGAATLYPLTGLGSKTTPEKLAEFLSNPLTVAPAGRMPHMLLSGEEARDLAWYLAASTVPGLETKLGPAPAAAALEVAFRRVDPRDDELAEWKKLGEDARVVELGKRSVIAHGCNNCHRIEPEGKPFASVMATDLEDIAAAERRTRGCLAEKPDKAPHFALTAEQRAALQAFLATGLSGPGSPAPAYHARVALERFNCLACHQKDTEGGLTSALIETLRKYERVENAEALTPPSLNGVAHKLRTSALRGVLLQSVRVRPWMGLRMPQFGEAGVAPLVEGLAALEGTVPDDGVHTVELTSAKLKAGRDLAGKGAFGCASCHDMAGVPNVGTRGPDLALTPSRVRYDWYLRWMEQPQRMQPGTRMPAVFTGGKSLIDGILAGHADAQAEALWAYFSLGNNMPLPEGLEPPKGLTVAVGDRPVLLRTFMPDAGSRAVALGYPGGVSAAYDANTCRLVYAWSGNFLDAAPVWANRGGAPAKVLGVRFWNSPAGCPVGLTEGDDPPDFGLRAKDPAYGAHVPNDQIYQGERHVRFGGYTLTPAGEPVFRYAVDGAKATVAVEEHVKAGRAPAGLALQRTFTLDVPGGRTAWLVLAETTAEPQLLAPSGEAKKLDKAVVPVGDGALLLPLEGDRVQVLRVSGAGAKYRVQKLGNTWQVLVLSPGTGGRQTLDVRLWQPYRNEPTLIKELLAGK